MASTDPFAVDWYELQDNYALVSSGVLWTIDYLDTLPMEAAMFWNKTTKVTLPAIFYFVARYCTLFYAYMRISYLARGTVSNKFCADTSYPTTVALNVMELCTNMLLLLRAYAIAGKNRAVLALGTTLILARTIYGLYINLTLEVPIAGLGRPFDPRCTWIRQNNSHETLFQRSQFVTPALALALDTLVFLAIITPTFSSIVDMRKLRRTGFIDRVVRDGALHYAVVLGLAVCLAVATISVIDGNATKALNSMGQIIAPFFNLVPNIIASRIFLNTHTYANMDKGNAYETMTSMSFAARAMGSIGAPLQSELCGDSFETDPTLHSATTDSDGQHETGEAAGHEVEETQTSHQHENIAVIATTSGNAGISYEVV